MEITEACRKAKEFLESAGHNRIVLSSAVPVWRITAETGILQEHEFEVLLDDRDGNLVQFRRLDDEKENKE